VTEEISKPSISQAPINVLFNPDSIAKKDVWDINLIQILEMLIKILNQTGKKDLRIAGMAALSSSLIHRMKVESIFALQKAAMEKEPLRQRTDVNIELINMPYRHESTYPVTLNELLELLENLIGTIANPSSRKGRQLSFEPVEAPNFKDYFISLEELVMNKISPTGTGILREITSELDTIDSIRCFFAVLFLAKDQKVELEQVDDDIIISLFKEDVSQPDQGSEKDSLK